MAARALVLLGTVTPGLAQDEQSLTVASVQAAPFTVPGSLSNAWADWESDIDMAISINGRAVRLYANEFGIVFDIGAKAIQPLLSLPSGSHSSRR